MSNHIKSVKSIGWTAAATRRLSLAVVMTHPTQFDSPLFARISRQNDFDVTVYYLHTPNIAAKTDPELGFSPNWDIPLLTGYNWVACPSGWLDRIKFLWRECFSSTRYDLVILPGYAIIELVLLTYFARNQALGMRLDTCELYEGTGVRHKLKSAVLKRLFKRYTTFHPVGSLSEAFLRNQGARAQQIFRFPYAVDNDYFCIKAAQFRIRRKSLLEEIGFPSDTFVVLGVLKFIHRETPMELLRGFQLFHLRHPGSALILVGAGELQREMEQYIEEVGLIKDVRLVGYSRYSELPKWYAAADVFVHPSSRESWGVSVNEAMACGLPVIIADTVGASYDLLMEGLNGYRYKSGDAEDLAVCLERVVLSAGHRGRVCEASQAAAAQFSYDASIASLEAALQSVRSSSSVDRP